MSNEHAKDFSPNEATGETVLWSGRTHFKILFRPIAIQIILILLHVLAIMYVPSGTGWAWWDTWGQWSIQGVLLALSLWYVIVPLLRWQKATFEVTDQRVIRHWGVLYRHSTEIPLSHIVSISVERGILDRIFGCGTLKFQDASSAAGSGQRTLGRWNRSEATRAGGGVRFYDVPGALDVKQMIDQAKFGSRS